MFEKGFFTVTHCHRVAPGSRGLAMAAEGGGVHTRTHRRTHTAMHESLCDMDLISLIILIIGSARQDRSACVCMCQPVHCVIITLQKYCEPLMSSSLFSFSLFLNYLKQTIACIGL